THDYSSNNLNASNTSIGAQPQDTQRETVDNAEQIDIEGEEAIRRYKKAVICVDETDYNSIRAKAFQYLGKILTEHFEYKKAIEYYKKARKISPGFEADRLEVEAYEWLGYNHLQVGHYQECIEYYNELVKLASQLSDENRKIHAYLGIGSAFKNTGDLKSSRKYYVEALTVAKQLNDARLEREAHIKLGHVYYECGEFDAALKSYLKAQEISRSEKKVPVRGQSLPGLFYLYGRQGQDRFLHRVISRVLDSRKDVANISIGFMLGNTFQQLKQEEKAIESYQQAINISKELKDKEMQMIAKQRLGTSCLTLASVCSKDRDYETAVRWYKEALDAFGTEPNNCLLREKALTGLGVAWFNLGCTEKAIESIQDAQKCAIKEADTGIYFR
ncbi:tetratricopeptide repeat, partial [Paramuricea clavata]